MRHAVRSMRWRIASTYVLLLTLTLSLLALVLLQQLRTTYLQTLEAGVAGQARLVALLAVSHPPRAADWVAQVRAFHDQLGSRVTLIAPDGTVLADSLASGTDKNLMDRPEVRDALALGQGESERFSVATGDNAFFVAVPVRDGDEPIGVVRVGVPLTTIVQAQVRLALVVFVAAALAGITAIGLAVVIARRTTQPLLELRGLAGRLASGDLLVQMPMPHDAEVAALTQDFNLMASRLRQVIHSLEAEQQRVTTILATMADGLLMLDATDDVTLLNPAAERLLALSAPLLPVPLATLPVAAAVQLAVTRSRQLPVEALPTVIEELTIPTRGQSLRAVVTRMPTDDHPVLVLLQDLTDLRRAEQARRMLLTNISHDLRTPLASLQAMIETLQDGALADPLAAADFLARMDAEVQGLTRLVTEFLELARIESGQLVLHAAPTALRGLLEGVASRMMAQAQQRGSTLCLDLPSQLPSLVIDAARIEQVVLNLLQNALTWTDAGGSVTLGAAVRDERIAIWVRDTGVGIAPSDLPHIFERFYKADRARSGGGTGLGLAIARQLVERHGGAITAASTEGEGTIVTITLPFSP